uniref:CFAP20 domain containing n=1 Tax=Amphiprion percula TaxID=161767 RepID=A0A3P8T054_AMPPE
MCNGNFFLSAVPDHSATARSTSYRRTRPQAVLHTASGSRASGPPPQTGRKSNASSDTMERSVLFIQNTESSTVTPTPAEFQLCSIRPGLSSDLQVWSSWESNEGSEPQLTLQEEVFTFSSHPHSPKRGQGQGDHDKMEVGDDLVQNKSGRRYDAKPEDDFIGSESDEVCFLQGRDTKLCLPNTNMQPSSSGKAEPDIMVPARCLSPNRHKHKSGPRGSEEMNQFLDKNSIISVLWVINLKAEEEEALKPVESSHYDLHLLGSLRIHGDDDEELRMLASLKREQEEDECRASGLSASQIHQCNVSISMSSDDTSTWTHISMLCMKNIKHCSSIFYLCKLDWRDESVNEEDDEDEYLNLLYDPCLNCYFDPKTGKYYELA